MRWKPDPALRPSRRPRDDLHNAAGDDVQLGTGLI